MKKNIIKIGVYILLFILILGIIIFINRLINRYKTIIPKVYFEGDISNMTEKSDIRKIKVTYKSDQMMFHAFAEIRVQGTSSLSYEKKNYTINLFTDNTYETKNKINMGWGEQSKYCLKANWIDKTHARNIVTAKLASEVSKKYNILNNTPNNGVIDGFPVEIYINGEFLGIYTWNIPKDAWMFNMDEENENHILFSNEGWEAACLFKEAPTTDTFEIEVGKNKKEAYDKLKRLSSFINESDDETFKKEFEQYLNFDATLNYLIIMEFALLGDNVAKNMLLATYDGKVWCPTLYDLDASWGTMYNGLEKADYEFVSYVFSSRLWERLIALYPIEIADRYFELREDILTKEHIMKLFNQFKALIPETSFESENKRWSNIPGYEYDQIQEFLDIRIPLMDKMMKDRKER